MYAVAVTIHVLPDRVAEFLPVMLENARGTRAEPGNVRYDVLQAKDDPAHFMLYEVYLSEEDFAAHQQTPHYLKWRDTVNPMMAERRQASRFFSRFFDNE